MKKILFLSALLLVCAWPASTRAQTPFGGLEIFMMPCTCSPFVYHAFAPLYLSNPTPIAGALAAPYTPLQFAYFYLRPKSWALGFYIPGGNSCMMYAGFSCFSVPVMGTITSFTGTSL